MFFKVAAILIYSLVIISIGIIGFRKTKSSKDFLLGGGNVGPFMTAFSYATAYFSAVVFIGFAGKIGWFFGYSGIWIGICNALIGVAMVWALMGWKVKKVAMELGATNMNEFLEKRYDSQFLRIFGSVAIFIFLIPYSAAVFIGLSCLFETSFAQLGLKYEYIVIFIAIFTSIYLVLGGYKSMVIIDVVFGVIMIVGVIIMAYFTVKNGGGFENITTKLSAIDPKLTEPIGPPGAWKLFCLIFLTSVAPFAMPQLVQKFYAVKDKNTIKIGMFASTLFSLLVGCVAYFMGATSRVFISPENTPTVFTDSGKPIVDLLMPELLNTIIPDYLLVVILLLLLSASMSTLASLILVSSSSIVKDFWHGFIKKEKCSDKELTKHLRIGSLLFIFISALIAMNPPASIVSIFGISWGAIGSIFLGPFVWGLFSKRVNKCGAIAAIITGLSMCLGLYLAGLSSPEAGTIGMLTSLMICPLASLFDEA
ncbi:MAG: sodium/solute symporter [Desulfotalea sp.]